MSCNPGLVACHLMEKPKLTAVNVVAVSFILFDPLVAHAKVTEELAECAS